MAASSFKLGLDIQSRILSNLTLHPFQDMDDLMLRVEKFCQLEGLISERSDQRLSGSLHHVQSSENFRPVHNVRTENQRAPKAHEFVAERTIFVAPLYLLLWTIQQLPFFSFPEDKLVTEGTLKDLRVHCTFHRCHDPSQKTIK